MCVIIYLQNIRWLLDSRFSMSDHGNNLRDFNFMTASLAKALNGWVDQK